MRDDGSSAGAWRYPPRKRPAFWRRAVSFVLVACVVTFVGVVAGHVILTTALLVTEMLNPGVEK